MTDQYSEESQPNSEQTHRQKKRLVFWDNSLMFAFILSIAVLCYAVLANGLGIAGWLSGILPMVVVVLVQQAMFAFYLHSLKTKRHNRHFSLWGWKFSFTILAVAVVARFLANTGWLHGETFLLAVSLGVVLNILSAVRFVARMDAKGN